MQGRKQAATVDVSRYLGVGLTWALSTLLFLWLGTLADGALGTRPLFTVLGAFVGAAAGFYYMIHHLVVVPGREAKALRQAERESDKGTPRG